MARVASTALVVALLAATAAAFALTEGLKLERSPIFGTKVGKVFSPVCRCETNRATIAFRLRKADRLDVTIVDQNGDVVDTLAERRRFDRGRVVFLWDGRAPGGQPFAQGSYRPRVHLRNARRTIVLPNPIEIDVTAPSVQAAEFQPPVISPDGDRHRDSIVVTYQLSEPARALLYVRGTKRVETRFPRDKGTLPWAGRVAGKAVRQGQYALSLRARDPAGNLGGPVRLERLIVRYVALGRKRIETRVGGRLAVRVSADARIVRWKLSGRSGTARPGTLVLRAPDRPGRFTLVVSANGRAARAVVLVRAAP